MNRQAAVSIPGRVTDIQTKKGIEKARISVTEQPGASTSSKAFGEFELKVVRPAAGTKLTLYVEAPGYVPKEQIVQPALERVDVELEPLPTR